MLKKGWCDGLRWNLIILAFFSVIENPKNSSFIVSIDFHQNPRTLVVLEKIYPGPHTYILPLNAVLILKGILKSILPAGRIWPRSKTSRLERPQLFQWSTISGSPIFNLSRGFQSIPPCFHTGLLFPYEFNRLVRFLTAVETHLVEKPMVDSVSTRIRFAHI